MGKPRIYSLSLTGWVTDRSVLAIKRSTDGLQQGGVASLGLRRGADTHRGRHDAVERLKAQIPGAVTYEA
jgi:hypothetical protein